MEVDGRPLAEADLETGKDPEAELEAAGFEKELGLADALLLGLPEVLFGGICRRTQNEILPRCRHYRE
jgi:hypothetical protein